MPTAAPNATEHPRHAVDDVLKKALRLAHELEGLLEAKATEGSFRFRLARAHALSAIDVLSDLALRGLGVAPSPLRSPTSP